MAPKIVVPPQLSLPKPVPVAKPQVPAPIIRTPKKKVFLQKELFQVRQADDEFRFFFYSKARLDGLNALSKTIGTISDKNPKLAISIPIAIPATLAPGSSSKIVGVRFTNRGTTLLTNVTAFVQLRRSSGIQAVTFGGIQPILKGKAAQNIRFPRFPRSNGRLSMSLIGVDETNNRIIYSVRRLAPGQWIQFLFAVEGQADVRANVISQEGEAVRDSLFIKF